MAHILALDDEEDICQLIERVLAGSGHQVTSFTEAREALEWLRYNKPDLALIDFKLKGSDGLSVLGCIRQNSPELKAIMITGVPSLEVRNMAAELGLEDYLLKPIDIAVLEEYVNRALGFVQG